MDLHGLKRQRALEIERMCSKFPQLKTEIEMHLCCTVNVTITWKNNLEELLNEKNERKSVA